MGLETVISGVIVLVTMTAQAFPSCPLGLCWVCPQILPPDNSAEIFSQNRWMLFFCQFGLFCAPGNCLSPRHLCELCFDKLIASNCQKTLAGKRCALVMRIQRRSGHPGAGDWWNQVTAVFRSRGCAWHAVPQTQFSGVG